MFRASPWISYEPAQRQSLQTDTAPHHVSPPSHHPPTTGGDMDAPEISTLREEEEETPPPDAAFTKFRVNLRLPARSGQTASTPGSAVGPPVGPPFAGRRGPSPPDSDDEEEEDQLIDDDELAIVTETGQGPNASSPGLAVGGSRATTPSPRKRGGATRGRGRRGGATGRRGRPGREPPDAAAMMSTFELTKTDQAGPSSAPIIPPPPPMIEPPPPMAGPSAGDWSSTTPPKPPRKKPGPKKGSTLGPRGPRKNVVKTSQNTSARGTPILDDPLLPAEPSAFLIPAPPSIPPTPGSDQPALPLPHLPPIVPPDFTLDPSIPIPIYPLPTRSFPVQAPPKVPSGYATTHPIDTKRGPVRKWKVAQREIKGIAGGRWFARSWVGERDKDREHLHMPLPLHPQFPSSPPPAPVPLHASSSRWAPPEPVSRASSVKAEPPAHGLSDSENGPPVHWSAPLRDQDRDADVRGPVSPRTRTSASPSPPRSADLQAGPS